MLFFRSEDHVDRWCRTWRLDRGAMLTIDAGWKLALAWFSADRRAPEWRRRTIDEVEELFSQSGLTAPLWS